MRWKFLTPKLKNYVAFLDAGRMISSKNYASIDLDSWGLVQFLISLCHDFRGLWGFILHRLKCHDDKHISPPSYPYVLATSHRPSTNCMITPSDWSIALTSGLKTHMPREWGLFLCYNGYHRHRLNNLT